MLDGGKNLLSSLCGSAEETVESKNKAAVALKTFIIQSLKQDTRYSLRLAYSFDMLGVCVVQKGVKTKCLFY